ncbi:MAG: HAMP domain-containing protein [Burkholderiales bacterium]|nr:HAMP domain-containing protein [Burkholderiales bacterium]
MHVSHLRLGTRLALGFGSVLTLGSIIAAFGWSHLATTHEGTLASTQALQRAALALEWTDLTRLNVNRAIALAKGDGVAALAAHFEPLMAATSADITRLQKALEAGVEQDPEARDMLERIGSQRTAYLKMRKEILAGLRAHASDAPAQIDARLLPAADAYVHAIEALREQQRARAASVIAASDTQVAHSQRWLLALAAGALAIGALGAWVLTRSVTVPLRRVAGHAERIAGGDLSGVIEVDARDEVGDVLRGLARMQEALRGLVGEMRTSADSIRLATGEVAEGSRDLSRRTEEQASNLQQTAASMEQLAAAVREGAETARRANAVAVDAAGAAAEGGTVVGRVVGTMEAISASSRRIADIIGVIDGIAFQTNILALNAAVEAARAGEQGRGFAVVASEVRSLAQRSAGAAREIKTLIGTSVEMVETGSKQVHDAGRSVGEIVEQVRRVSELIASISNVGTAQDRDIAQVGAAVRQLDEVTQRNAAMVEESANATSSLDEQAGRLAGLVGRFRIDA